MRQLAVVRAPSIDGNVSSPFRSRRIAEFSGIWVRAIGQLVRCADSFRQSPITLGASTRWQTDDDLRKCRSEAAALLLACRERDPGGGRRLTAEMGHGWSGTITGGARTPPAYRCGPHRRVSCVRYLVARRMGRPIND